MRQFRTTDRYPHALFELCTNKQPSLRVPLGVKNGRGSAGAAVSHEWQAIGGCDSAAAVVEAVVVPRVKPPVPQLVFHNIRHDCSCS